MRYVCGICGYIYDDAKEKIPFNDLPETWKCPLCGALKSDFRPEEPVKETAKALKEDRKTDVREEDLVKLSCGQLSAVFSNLSRGCEKQYRPDEAEGFKKLAEYYKKKIPGPEEASAEELAQVLLKDIESYPHVRETADENGDRGAARICVWGEKVTRMLYSLVSRYLKEGEDFLKDTDIWVCTTCGFVYAGDKAPEICPVCKVPSRKFERIGGRGE